MTATPWSHCAESLTRATPWPVAAALGAVAAREPGIIVDLAGLEFIDSSGVAALVRGRRQAWEAGGDLVLAAPQQTVMRVLAVIRLANAFSVYATVEEAADEAGCFRVRVCRRGRGGHTGPVLSCGQERVFRGARTVAVCHPVSQSVRMPGLPGAGAEGNTDVNDARTGAPQ